MEVFMFQKKRSFFVFIVLLIIAFSGYTFDTSILEARDANQTIPTRTPIPEPTDDNSGGNGGGNSGGNNGNSGGSSGGGGTSPTATPVPPTATPTLSVTIGPTPIGGYIEPEVCGPPYFISVEGNTNVRQGPDTTYEVATKLVYLEARQIIGRSANLEWWYILLSTGDRGWVANVAGEVVGNIGGVPLVNESGGIVDVAPSWNPTPNPECPTVTPTATAEPPTETPVPPTATAVPETSSEGETATDSGTTEEVVEAEPTATAVPPTETPAPPTATPTATIEPTATEEPVTGEPETTAEQESTTVVETTEEEPASGGVNWVLVSGAALLALGGGAFFLQGRGKQ